MSNTAIEFSNVTKIYNIRERGYRTFRDSCARSLNKIRQKFKRNPNSDLSSNESNVIRALDNVSFSVDKGKALGIIGANGSGKTTILRLLANVTEPSSGEISVSGKVAPLIQVGAGFHPELTGRENVYLNATIMGLSRKEIYERYDDIVSFAELDRFMDTPIKRYSSGMYVRLGFSVAVHINLDILLIDEILAVGDLSFQRKCLDTMSKIRKTDKTIIFVSHNIFAIKDICDRVIWLNEGKIRGEGNPSEVVDEYITYMTAKSQYLNTDKIGKSARWGTGEARCKSIEILNLDGKKTSEFIAGDLVRIRFEYEAKQKIDSPVFYIGVFNDNDDKIFGSYYNKERANPYSIKGNGVLECTIDTRLFRSGIYYVMPAISGEIGTLSMDAWMRAASFVIHKNKLLTNYDGYGAPGIVNMPHEWKKIK